MSMIFHLTFCVVLLLLIDRSIQQIAPVFTPDNESLIQNHKSIDQQLDKSSIDNLHTSEVVLQPAVAVDLSLNQTNVSKSTQNNSNGNKRKRKYHTNKQYRPNERKNNQYESLTYNIDSIKKNQLNDLNNALLMQLANSKLAINNNNQQDILDKYSPFIGSLTNSMTNTAPVVTIPNSDSSYQLVPIYMNDSPAGNDPNQLAVQLYLRKLAQLAQLQKQARSGEMITEKQQEKAKLTKRVSNQPLTTSASTNNLQQFTNLNQLLAANQQQPIYTLLQPPQQQSQANQPLYLALQPSFPMVSSSNNRDLVGQQQNSQMNSLIETGDKIYAKIKQWGTDVFNPKSSLNRQITEVLGVVSNVALVTLIAVPMISLLSLGIPSLMQPLSQLHTNRKSDKTKSASTKQKTKSEDKKDIKDEKTAKSDASTSQKNTKMLDKRSRLVSLMERAGDEFNHFKNLVEIAKNFELAFKKYSVNERECKYRVLCEVSSSNQANETGEYFLSNNLLREGRRKRRSISNKASSENEQSIDSSQQQKKSVSCDSKDTSNCTIANSGSSIKQTVKETTTNISTQSTNRQSTKKTERNQRPILRNFIRGLIDGESFVSFFTTIDQLMNRAQRSNFFNYLINEEQINQAFRSDGKLFKTISERSKQLQDKLRDFLENLTVFQQVVSKESQNLDNGINSKNNKYRMFYNLARSKRTATLNHNETSASTMSNYLDSDGGRNEDNVDISGLHVVLTELIHQLKHEQNNDNLILPLSRVWLSPYLSAYEYGLNNGSFETVISNNHLQNVLKKKPNQTVQKISTRCWVETDLQVDEPARFLQSLIINFDQLAE